MILVKEFTGCDGYHSNRPSLKENESFYKNEKQSERVDVLRIFEYVQVGVDAFYVKGLFQ